MTRSTFDCYECEEDDCNLSEERLSYCKDALYCWKSTTLRKNDVRERNARGCIFNQLYSELFCDNSTQIKSHYRAECCEENFCNGGVFPIMEVPKNGTISHPDTYNNPYLLLAIFGPMVGVFLIIITIGMCYHLQDAYYYASSDSSAEGQQEQHEMMMSSRSEDTATNEDNDKVLEYVDRPSSASQRAPRTNLTNEITLHDKWTIGNFGANHPLLWSATYHRKRVMVKIYPLSWEETWNHETEVYTTLLTKKHENVLEYIGKDTARGKAVKQFWIVTRLPLNGSLVKYLQETRLDKKAMFKACTSLTRGLSYLHMEIPGKRGKLGIAHRNLCSHNVFVNRDGSCVIGGFECAVTEDFLNDDNFLEIAAKRYMSPEYILHFENSVWCLDSFQLADVYSLSLLFWEICRMCIQNNVDAPEYAGAYAEFLTNGILMEPTIEEMRQVIIDNKNRPAIPGHWTTDPVMDKLGSIIQACWDMNITMRLSLLDIKKELAILADS